MSNGRQGTWPPHPQGGNSSHSSPSNSIPNFGAGGDFTPNPNAQFQGMTQPNAAAAAAAAAATAAARYNASMMTPPGYGSQGPSGPPTPQQQYGQLASGSNYFAPSYAQQVQQPQPVQHHPRAIPSPTAPQQQAPSVHAQTVFHPSVHPYAGYGAPPTGVAAGAPPQQHAMGPSSDMTYAGAWVSSVPSSYTPQDGSAFTKSVHYQNRDGQAKIKAEVQMQPSNSQMSGLPYQPQHLQQQQYVGHPQTAAKNERGYDNEDDGEDNDDADGEGGSKKKGQKGASEFVKKLFRMLDDTSYASIVSWSPTADSFIVRDMNDFTKHVLPRQFRHSNFASFVRQLNKYDFHKVKMTDETGQPQHLGVDQQWEFRHPAFMQGREDLLEHVRRKAPLNKKANRGRDDDGSPRDGSPNMPGVADAADKGAREYTQLKDQVATLTASQDQMTSHINNLTKQYQAVIGEMLTFQKNMVQQDQLMQNLIQYLMNLEADRKIEGAASTSTQHAIKEAPPASSSRPQLENSGAFVSSADAEKLVHNFRDAARASFSQMSQISQRAAAQSGNAANTPSTHSVGGGSSSTPSQHRVSAANEEALSPKSSHATPATMVGQSPQANGGMKGKERESFAGATSGAQQTPMYFHPPHLEDETTSNDLFSAAASALDNPSLAGFEGAGLRVFTVGTLQPRSDASDATDPAALHSALSSNDTAGAKAAEDGSQSYGISVPNLEQLPAGMPRVDGRSTSSNVTPKPGAEGSNAPGTPSESGGNMLRVRRSTYVPGWAVPPKVLVVDDDDVCRKLGSKFLQVFGCAIDVAVDGVTAVNKMNLEKYDLVLMDIVMPNLDGVSATSLIREFDARTPIISMTSNSGPQELLSYMSSGMNDVLPKPFTKEGLLNMLEKHLIHLKTVQKMDEIPKALGLPPISEGVMQDILSATAASAHTMGASLHGSTPGDGANPMAAMMGNGPEMLRASVDAGGSRDHTSASNGGAFFGDDEGGLVNPLAGMGFSDEEYISMLQNLIAAGSVSDNSRGETADTVANVMGVARGEGATATMAGVRSKESTPNGGSQRGSMLPPQGVTRKRSSETGGTESMEAKKSRFTELST